MLQKEVIEAGEQIASDLIDANISKDMGNMGGHVIRDISEYDNSDLLQKYLDGEIVSVEAIYIAMKRAEKVLYTSTNTARNEICPECKGKGVCESGNGKRWTCVSCNGTGKLSAIA